MGQYSVTVWWGTPVEMRSAFERLLRLGDLPAANYAAAGGRLEQLRRSWREMYPSDEMRAEAERLLSTYPLKAADALQLAAASIWAGGSPASRVFVSGDGQLLEAARQAGFQVEAV